MWSYTILGCFFLFLFRSGTTGLFKANIRYYFAKRYGGTSHREAIDKVIRSRYRLIDERDLIKAQFERIPPSGNVKEDLTQLVYLIFCYESGIPATPELENDIRQQIDDVYESISRRFNIND